MVTFLGLSFTCLLTDWIILMKFILPPFLTCTAMPLMLLLRDHCLGMLTVTLGWLVWAGLPLILIPQITPSCYTPLIASWFFCLQYPGAPSVSQLDLIKFGLLSQNGSQDQCLKSVLTSGRLLPTVTLPHFCPADSQVSLAFLSLCHDLEWEQEGLQYFQ